MPDEATPEAPLRVLTPSEHGIQERARLVVHDRRSKSLVVDAIVDPGASYAVGRDLLPPEGDYRFKLQVWRDTRWVDMVRYQPLLPKPIAKRRAAQPEPPPAPSGPPVRVVKPADQGIHEASRLVVNDLRTDQVVLRADIAAGASYEVLSGVLPVAHNDYAWKLQARREGRWSDVTAYELLVPELETPDGVSYALLPEPGSSRLVVVFQATGHKNRRFNYVKPLAGVPVHRLYIKHDYGAPDIDLGPLELEPTRLMLAGDAVQALLRQVCKSLQLQPADCIFAGSSKGGSAALYHGLVFGAGDILPGGPQVLFGDAVRPRLHGVPPEELEPMLEWLNGLLFEHIRARRGNMPRVLVHVGRGDPHHAEHAVPLKEYVDAEGIGGVELDVADYETHSELPAHYRLFLRREVIRILQEQDAAPAA